MTVEESWVLRETRRIAIALAEYDGGNDPFACWDEASDVFRRRVSSGDIKPPEGVPDGRWN